MLKIKDEVTLKNSKGTTGYVTAIHNNNTTCNVVWGCDSYDEAARYSRELSDTQLIANLRTV